MKNKDSKIFSLLALGLISCYGIGCSVDYEGDSPVSVLKKEVEVYHGTLKFSSFEHYEKLITGEEKVGELSYLSFQENLQDLLKNIENHRVSQEGHSEITKWEGSTLLELLDQHGFIILEDHLIYLNFNNRTAVVSSDLGLKESILEGNIYNEVIRLYSFDDDVIGLLETNSPSTIQKSTYNSRIANVFDPLAATVTEGCSWSKCDNSQYFDDPQNGDILGISYLGGSYRYRIDAKHVYDAAAISFRLFSKAKHMRKPEDGSLFWNAEATDMKLWYEYEYLSKKSNSQLVKRIDSSQTFNNELEATYYSSSRGLEKFYLKTQFYAVPGGNHGYSPVGAFWQFNLARIYKSY